MTISLIDAANEAGIGHSGVRITSIETIVPDDIMPGLMLLRIHTDAGHIGHGETYYAPHAVAAMIHDYFARYLLGKDACAVEAHWRWLYERTANFGARGAELRAISAIDLALWDILGKVANQPVWRLLGGPVRQKIQVYNTCGGPSYGRNPGGNQGWPGYGDEGKPGPLEDNWSSFNAAGDLAEELIAEGITGMKLWPFDRYAHRNGGHRISTAEVEEGMKPLREIRDRVGMDIEIHIEGHAFFNMPAALRIADALREIKPLWLEDLLRVDCVDSLAEFRRRSNMPIAASEMYLARQDFQQLLERHACDFVMIDPTWAGGISETNRIAHMAGAYNLPVTIHDCTGPLTLFAGLQVAFANPTVTLQETVRAHIRTLYPQLIEETVTVKDGAIAPPTAPGLGVTLLPALFNEGHPQHRETHIN